MIRTREHPGRGTCHGNRDRHGNLHPLNELKKSPRNARKTPHSEAHIEALAASIAAKGILQNLVVEPEANEAGETTGFYFVTIGECRRLAQLLRLKRKEIKKTEPIRCVLNIANDPQEISLDENVTRANMHSADQFEAFRELAENRAWGAAEIAVRFGVSEHVVKQRLRLGAVKHVLDSLGTATEMRAMQNYAGHRLAPWLAHIMVSRQETARALMTPGEIMQLPPDDQIVMIAGIPPIHAKKARYFQDERFKERLLPVPASINAFPASGRDDWAALPPIAAPAGKGGGKIKAATAKAKVALEAAQGHSG